MEHSTLKCSSSATALPGAAGCKLSSAPGRRETHIMVTKAKLVALLVSVWLALPCVVRADVSLPGGVKAVWDIEKADRQKTPTRERVCLNGLWQWQPAGDAADAVPAGRWGYFKVPGCWPGITDYMQKDCQTLFADPSWKNEKLSSITAAWYKREITIPADWAGRRISLSAEYLNSYAAVFVDGKKVGEIRFPGGELDLSAACKPGGKHELAIFLAALPLKGVMLSYSDSASAREAKGSVERRGLCGDVYLTGEPAGPRIADVKVDTSVRKGEIVFDAALTGLAESKQYTLRAEIRDNGQRIETFTSNAFAPSVLKGGHLAFTAKWDPPKLWDLHTPGNLYQVDLSLLDEGNNVADTALPVRFGFREFWIDGRDFYLNGSRIYLSCVPLDNAQVGAAWASYEGAKESMLRLQSFGINFVYTHNYGCEPGTHLSFAEILRAADDVGMLVSFSQPHFGQYDWKALGAEANNLYARHAEFYVRAAQNHPAVVMYSMSHNATGYAEDMNPDMIDGLSEPRDRWALNNAKLALRAEAIVKRLDPGRIVYHHASGNLGSMDAMNFYPNWAPIQEMSDWFEHWAAKGVKPAFTCEYGAPFTWDWTMYRGWYKGERTFGSADVPWEFCFAEWNAQFLGDRAFKIGEPEKANLRWENKQFRAGKLWHRWDYPFEVDSAAFDDRYAVFAMYLNDNWPAFRSWGLSVNSPWEFGHFWRLKPGVDRGRKELKVDWEGLQRPGFSADYIEGRYERMDLAYERTDWEETPAAKALIRNNGPVLVYIGGNGDHFTEKGHNFRPGETVEKQIIVINNARQPVTGNSHWGIAWPQIGTGGFSSPITLRTGEQERIPIRFAIPAGLPAGKCNLTASVQFSNGEKQEDTFTLHVLPPPDPPKVTAKIALFDPKGETGKWLAGLGVRAQSVDVNADLAGYDVLVIGKQALTVSGPGPDIGRVREGLKVVVFEQTSEVLQKRLGFRTTEYGLRQVFPRVPDHPLLAGLSEEHLRDWQGAATNTPSRLTYEMRPRYGPTVKWCDIDVTRVWRCGNWGSVASVLIEKPATGDFLPILDGGFSLQYSPLMVCREGKGMILFCQMDVTGRTENDPAAEILARNILQYASDWNPQAGGAAPAGLPVRAKKILYAGEAGGKAQLAKMGVAAGDYDGGALSPDQVLMVGPSGGRKFSASAAAVGDWLKAGGCLLAIGLDEAEAGAFLPFKVNMKKAEHIATFFEPQGVGSLLAGIASADVHDRETPTLPLVTDGAQALGDGVLAKAVDVNNVVFFQIAPWQLDYAKQYNLKRTFRRSSFVVARLLAAMGAAGPTPIVERFKSPVDPRKVEKRWLDGLYLDPPEEMDDPYRFFRW
jgi:beta-galactosidase/beta-glucuronidase